MIDGSEKRKHQLAFRHWTLRVFEKHSKMHCASTSILFLDLQCIRHFIAGISH